MVVILYQQKFGGTDFLLGRLESWLIDNKYPVVSERDALAEKRVVDLVIMPTSEMNRVNALSRQGLKFKKILVWSMGHGAFKAAFYNNQFENFCWGLPKKIVDVFINAYASFLLRDNSLVFTDLVGLHYDLKGIDLSSCNPDKLVIPIAIADSPVVLGHKPDKDKVTIGWVGRISKDFKVLPLIKLIGDLRKIAGERHNILRLVIVGDGDGASLIKDMLPSIDDIEIEWIKAVDIKELGAFINQNIDILFAMGTSALDGANAFTPTVVVQPFSTADDEPKNGYRWIFDSKGFSLGEFAGLDIKPQQVDVAIETIFDDIGHLGLNALSEKSKAYSLSFLEKNVFPKIFSDLDIKATNKGVSFSLFLLATFYGLKLKLKKVLNK